MKNVLVSELPSGKDTPANRDIVAQKETKKITKALFVPKDIEKNVLEGFEPLTVTGELLETHF